MPVHKRAYKKGGSPVWYYEFWYEKRRYHKTGYLARKDAEKAEVTKRREVFDKRGRPVDPQRISLPMLLPKYLDYRAVENESRIKRESLRSKPVVAFFGNRLLTDYTVGDVQDYVVKRKKDGLQPRSINLELLLLRTVFKYALQNNYASVNPAREVPLLKVFTKEKFIPNKEELDRFIAAAAKTYSGKVMVAWAWFMAYVGTRPGESYHMEWSDIDFQNDLIYIRPKQGHTLKNGKFRVVNMHPELKPILLEYRKVWEETFQVRARRHPDEKTPPHDWVFYNPRKQLERVISFNKCFYYARKEANLLKLSPHGFRHFFISYCLMSGILPQTIIKWVGHSSTKMIEETYGHLIPSFKAEEMSKLSFTIKKTRPPTPSSVAGLPEKSEAERCAVEARNLILRTTIPEPSEPESDAEYSDSSSATTRKTTRSPEERKGAVA